MDPRLVGSWQHSKEQEHQHESAGSLASTPHGVTQWAQIAAMQTVGGIAAEEPELRVHHLCSKQ